MTDLSTIKPSPGSKFRKKREGRGRAGYGGKTCGRGNDGQGQRAGKGVRPQFEGGQTPLYRRLPKKQYISCPNRKLYSVINVGRLAELAEKHGLTSIDAQILISIGALSKIENSGLKILGGGDISLKLTVLASAFSAEAKQKIEAAGGTVELLGCKVLPV